MAVVHNGIIENYKALRAELAACQAQENVSCTYVARTAFRFLPEFIEAGAYETLVAIFQESRTSSFALHLITGRNNGRSHQAALDFIRRRHGGPVDDASLAGPGG